MIVSGNMKNNPWNDLSLITYWFVDVGFAVAQQCVSLTGKKRKISP